MIIKSTEDFPKILGWIKDQSFITLDIETDGLDVRNGQIIGFGISNLSESFYFPTLEYDGKQLLPTPIINEVHQILHALHGQKLITFNGAFDIPFIKNYFGVDLLESLWCDALLAKHTVDEEHPFQLKQIAKKLYGADAKKEQEEMMLSVKKNGGSGPGDMYKCDLDILAKYCEQDCILTSKIAMHYLAQIRKQNLEQFFFEEEVMPLYKEVTIPMEQNGIPVDVPLLRNSLSEISKDLDLLEDEIQQAIAPDLDNFMNWYLNRHYPVRRTGVFAQAFCSLYKLPLPKTKSNNYSLSAKALETLHESEEKRFLTGQETLHISKIREVQLTLLAQEEQRYPFNIASKDHLKRLFFQELGEKAESFTELGNPQVDDAFLDKMADKYDWVVKLRDFNKLRKIKGTYIERVLDKQEDGVFYPSFFQHRTVSGRYGSDLQQLPRPLAPGQASELVRRHNNKIRTFFISGADHVFVDADYESLEPHVFAHVSGDERLRDIFRRGDDFYSTIAIKTEGIERVSANKQSEDYLGKSDPARRQKAKAYALGIPYGMSPYKLQFEIGVSVEEAEKLVEGYLSGFPELRAWMQQSNEQACHYGMVRSEAGRVRHLWAAKRIYEQHGLDILNSLYLWKQFNNVPAEYEKMKKLRKTLSNQLNNAKNFQIQSLATSIVNRAAIAISRYMRDNDVPGYVCAQVHDQLIVRVPESYGALMQGVVQDIMENNYKLSIALKAPAELGHNFLEAH